MRSLDVISQAELRRRLGGAHPTTRLSAAVRDRVLAELAAAAPDSRPGGASPVAARPGLRSTA